MRKRMTWFLAFLAIIGGAALMVAGPGPAFAGAEATGSHTDLDCKGSPGGVPALAWECKLKDILKGLRGPVMKAVALMGIIVAGWGLIWGGEIGEFARRVIMLTLVLSFLLGMNAFYDKLKTSMENSSKSASTSK